MAKLCTPEGLDTLIRANGITTQMWALENGFCNQDSPAATAKQQNAKTCPWLQNSRIDSSLSDESNIHLSQ